MNIHDSSQQKAFWSTRYENNSTGWDIGHPSTPHKAYIDQLEAKSLKILIPGAGNGYEAEYLFQQGFSNVHILDISPNPLKAFAQRVSNFPDSQLIEANFFEHQGEYDLILEQTFFCSFPPDPEHRKTYASKMHELLRVGGKLVGLWFTFPLSSQGPPFGGSISEYETYFAPLFDIKVFEPCYNSIAPRAGREAFAIMEKR